MIKKHWKKYLIGLGIVCLTASLLLIPVSVSEAKEAGWLNQDGRWYYIKKDGGMESSGWKTIDGVKYCFNENGEMYSNRYIGERYVNESGAYDESRDITYRKKSKDNTKELNRKLRKPTEQEYEMIAEGINRIPGNVLSRFLQDGWRFSIDVDESGFSTRSLEAPGDQREEDYLTTRLDTSNKIVYAYDADDIAETVIGYYLEREKITETYYPVIEDILGIEMTMQEEMMYGANYRPYGGYFGVLLTRGVLQYTDPGDRTIFMNDDPKMYAVIDEIVHKYGLTD